MPVQARTGAEPLWFIHNLARVHVGGEASGGELAVVEVAGRRGDMPPLHVHHRDDETFFVLEGRLSLHVEGGEPVALAAGEAAIAPRGVPHVYRVESETARWLTISTPSGFDAFVREASDPAPSQELPPADAEPDLARIAAAAERHGIELLGPPGTLPS